MLLAGSLTWVSIERVYLTTQRENLLAQARLTATALSGVPFIPSEDEVYSQTTNISPGIHTRLLNESAAVIIGVPFPEGEDPVQVPLEEDPGYVPAEDLLKRQEIHSALSGSADTAIRQISSLGGSRVLYAAAPVLDGNGEVINIVYIATPLPQRGLPIRLTLQLLGALLGGLFLAGLLGLILATRISQPLEVLDKAASAISQGDLSIQIPNNGDLREVENLSRSFNEMSASLRHSNQLKNAFIADVTHELRTPLTILKGTVETLEDGALDDLEGRGKLLNSLGKETNRLIRLVNDLLTLTRADASALKLNPQEINLEDLIESRCQLLEPLSRKKTLQINFSKDGYNNDSLPTITADPDRLSQVLDNILDNAIRYAPDDSQITITLNASDDYLECSISDQGPGIPAEHIPFIFERFYRVDPARDRGTGGSGLGLAIARSLVEAQGGKIRAESRVGTGTTVTFTLPTS
jgi:signal transduction histidine kinase